MQQHPPSIKQMKTKSLGEKQNRCVLVGYWLKHHKNKQTVLQHWGKTERVLVILSKTTKFQNWGLRRISIDIIQNIFSNTLVEKYIFHISLWGGFFYISGQNFPPDIVSQVFMRDFGELAALLCLQLLSFIQAR